MCREPFRFLLNKDASDLYNHFTDHMKWASLEPRPQEAELSSSAPRKATSLPGVLDETQVFLPGSGIAKKLYSLRCVNIVSFE